MSMRRTHCPEYKARVGIEAISGLKTIQEIAPDHATHAIQVSHWKRQLLHGASELFTRGSKTKVKEAVQAKEEELFKQIGRLQMELEWLKKNLSWSDARELRKLVDDDHPELSVSRQCVLLGLPRSSLYCGRRQCVNRCFGSWPGSMRCTKRIPAAVAAGWSLTWPEKGSRSRDRCQTPCGA
jgi:putative transposase